MGERLSVCVRAYRRLSCLLLRCAGCCLTALPRLLHISHLRANLEHKQKPTHWVGCRPNPCHCSALTSLSLSQIHEYLTPAFGFFLCIHPVKSPWKAVGKSDGANYLSFTCRPSETCVTLAVRHRPVASGCALRCLMYFKATLE